MMLTLKPFTQIDWYGLAGAERPDENTEPEIAEITIHNLPAAPEKDLWEDGAVLVVDKTGVTINVMSTKGYCGTYQKNIGFVDGKEFATEFLSPEMSHRQMLLLGFEWSV